MVEFIIANVFILFAEELASGALINPPFSLFPQNALNSVCRDFELSTHEYPWENQIFLK